MTAQRLTAALAGACLAASCGDSPSGVSPTPGPKLTCPAPISQASATGGVATVFYTLPTVSGGVPPIAGPTCTPPTGSSFPPGVNTVACTVTDSQAHSDLCTFTVTVTAPPKLSVTSFLAFGDSMTYSDDGRNAPSDPTNVRASQYVPQIQVGLQDQYPYALKTELQARYTSQASAIMVDNQGKPLESAADPMTYVRFTGLLGSGSYGAVLLMEGANDLANAANTAAASGNPTDALTIEAQAVTALGRMIDFANSTHVRVFLATLPPENPNGCCPADRGGPAALVPGFNAMIQTLAASKAATLVDVSAAFNNDLTLISPDGLHPNIDGYHLIAKTFFASIQKTLEVGAPTTTSAAPPVKSPTTSAIRRR